MPPPSRGDGPVCSFREVDGLLTSLSCEVGTMADMKRSIAFLFVLSFVLLVPSDVRAQFDALPEVTP